MNGRLIEEPMVVYDCDRPVMTCAAFIFTTAERAKSLRQTPVYVLNHTQNAIRGRSRLPSWEEKGTVTGGRALFAGRKAK